MASREASFRSLDVGDEIEAKILKFDQEKNRVSLGIKQMGDDPWNGLARRYPARHPIVSARLPSLTGLRCVR